MFKKVIPLKLFFIVVAILGPITMLFISCDHRRSSSNNNLGVTNLICDQSTGLKSPINTCSPSNICKNLSQELLDEGITEIASPSEVPTCKTTNTSQRTAYDDGAAQSFMGIDGTVRYACIFKPSGGGLKPLVIWFHPGGNGNADLIYDQTNLRKKAIDYDLGGASPGFILASVQGRALDYPMLEPRDGNHHDFFFRSLESPSLNPDINLTDNLIDTLVNEGGVDPSKIYLIGWSNGAMFAQLYGVARHSVPTPGGYKVKSVAVYSGGDPFHNVQSEQESPSCRLNPYPKSNVPIFILRRSCDGALACNSQQQQWFETPPGHDTETWKSLANSLGFNISTMTIDGRGIPVSGCKTSLLECSSDAYGIAAVPGCISPSSDSEIQRCAELASITNHLRWPDGVLDNSGNDYEVNLLEFLKSN